MNAWIKGALIFAVGVLAGAGGTYLALDKKYEALLEEQIEDVRDRYRAKILENWDKVKETASTEESESSKATHISQEEYEESVSSEEDRVDYTKFARHDDIPTSVGSVHTDIKKMRDELEKVSEAVHDDDFDEHMAERESPEEDEDDEENEYQQALIESQRIADEQEQAKNEGVEPYPITRAEYLNQKSWYEKLSWNFYQDGFVTDDGDEKVDGPEDCLGPNLIEAFGLDGDDPDVAYIRDDQRARDIEVCRVAEDYYPKRPVVADVKLSSEE